MAWFQGPTGIVWLVGRLADLAAASGEYEQISAAEAGTDGRAQAVRAVETTPEKYPSLTINPFTLYKVGASDVYLGDIELTGGGGGGGGGESVSVTGPQAVPARLASGTGPPDLSLTYTGSATAGTLVYRQSGGVTAVGTPTSDAHAATKGYVDSAAAAAQPISHITGLQAALDAKTPTSRTITAGTGLTGGGALTSNRTLSADIASGPSVRDAAKLLSSADPRVVYVADGFDTSNIPAAIASAPASAGIVLIPVAEE